MPTHHKQPELSSPLLNCGSAVSVQFLLSAGSVDTMMDDRQTSTNINEKRRDRSDETLKFADSQAPASKSPLKVSFIAAQTGSLNELSSLSERISTEDAASPSADVSVNISHEETAAGYKNNCKNGATRASPPCQHAAEKDQRKHLQAPQPPPSETTASTRSQKSPKANRVDGEADGSDLCAAVLLACLFCHPLECLLATLRGCDMCVWSVCSSVCGCERTGLQPLLDFTHNCEPCGCAGVRWLLCDCPVCDVCLQATECLDLAMEMSQMLYH